MNPLMDFEIKISRETQELGEFSIGPLPHGYGYTLGNALRRVLLSSLRGAAVSEVRIAGILHQFSTISGMKEDIVTFTLNLKRLRLKLHGDDPVALKLESKGIGEVKASDITPNPAVEVVNSNLLLATLTKKSAVLDAELLVEPGYGYRTQEAPDSPKIGVFPLDCIFTPVLRVSYNVEETRVGEITNLDKLIIEIQTDATIAPFAALEEAAKIMVSYFSKLSGEASPELKGAVEAAEEEEGSKLDESEKGISIEDLDLPLRTINSLKKAKIRNLGELVARESEDLLKIRGLGEKSIRQIDELMKKEDWK